MKCQDLKMRVLIAQTVLKFKGMFSSVKLEVSAQLTSVMFWEHALLKGQKGKKAFKDLKTNNWK